MNILIIAYACEPNRGSEPGVGWNWTNLLATHPECNVTVITRKNNKSVIENYLTYNNMSVDFLYYDLPDYILKYKKGDRHIKIFFTLWQLGVISFLKKNINLNKYHLIWEFNFGSLTLPTFVYKLEKPYIVGPISTKKSIPKAYQQSMSFSKKIKYCVQQFMRENLWTNYFTWKTIKKAQKIITCNELTKEYLPNDKFNDSLSIFHNGIVEDIDSTESLDFNCNEIISFIYAGRLISSKNLDIAIEAFAKVKKYNDKFIFNIFGTGNEKKRLEALVKELNLTKNVFFYDKILQQDLFEEYKKSDCFMFPSLLEISSTSVMEAMYYGLVPICLEIPCMEYIYDNDCIVKIPCISPEIDSFELSKKILEVLENKNELKNKKFNCHNIAKENFLWNKKGEEVDKILNFITN